LLDHQIDVADPADVLRHQPMKWLALLAADLDGGAGHRAPLLVRALKLATMLPL